MPDIGPEINAAVKATYSRMAHRPFGALETVGGRVGSAARYSSSDASAKHRDEEDLKSFCGQEAQASGTYGGSGWHGRGGRQWRPQGSEPNRPGPMARHSNAGDSAHASCNEGMIAGQSIDLSAERHPGEPHTMHRG